MDKYSKADIINVDPKAKLVAYFIQKKLRA